MTTLSATSQSTTFDITLTDDQVSLLNSTSTSSYVHYYDGPGLTTRGIDLQIANDTSLETISEGLTKIPTLATDADGVFSLTFDTSDLVNEGNNTANVANYGLPERLPRTRLRLQRQHSMRLPLMKDNAESTLQCHKDR